MKKSPPSKAPTGRKTIAQGKEQRDAALGPPPPQKPSPEGAGQLPIGWEICRFDSVAQVISGRNQKEVESTSGIYPIYGSGGTFGRATSYLCEPGTTVIGRKGTINSPIFVNECFWNVDTAFGLFPISCDALLPRILFYFCRLFDFTALDKSTTIPSLAKRDIEAITIPLPPLAEQRRIVAKIEELFSELDAGEECLRHARRQLGVYRQSLLKQAFEGKLTEQWREQKEELLEDSDQLLKRIQGERQARYEQHIKEWETNYDAWENGGAGDKRPAKPRKPQGIHLPTANQITHLPNLPPEWSWIAVANCAVEISDGPFGSNLKSSDYVGSGVRVVRLENIGAGEFIEDKESFISHEKYEILKRHTVRLGDIVVASFISDAVRAALIPQSITYAVNKADCFKVHCFGASLSAQFLLRCVGSRYFFKQLEKLVHGVGRPRINTTQLGESFVPLCSLPEQREIVRLLDEQFTVIEQNQREIDAALKRSAALRQSILKKAFTGQLVPPACRQAGKTPEEFPQPMPGKWWVYVLKCDDGSFYKGFTDHLPDRWKRHLAGTGAKWTKQHPPAELYYWEEHWSEASAVQRERYLKSGSGREWFQHEVVEKSHEYEPASKLLERIREERETKGKSARLKNLRSGSVL